MTSCTDNTGVTKPQPSAGSGDSMRITVVVLYPNRHVIDLFEGLKTKGYEIEYYFFDSIPVYRQSNAWQVPEASTFLSILSPRTYLSLLRNSRSSKAVFFQSLVSPFLVNAAIQLAVQLLRGKRFVLSEGTRNRSRSRRFTKMLAKLLFDSDTVQHLSIGSGAAEDYARYGFTNWRYRKFCFAENYNSVEGPRWDGCPEDAIVILCVGRLLERKNFAEVIEAMKDYSGTRKVTIAICGSGPQESLLREAAEGLPSNVSVHMAGHCSKKQLDTFYRRADIFVLSSIYEGWGVVVNHALQFGLPLVLSSNVRSGEGFLLKNGVNGLSYASRDGLTGALQSLIDNDQLREAMALESIKHNQMWNLGNVVERLHKVIVNDDIEFNDEGPLSKIVLNDPH